MDRDLLYRCVGYIYSGYSWLSCVMWICCDIMFYVHSYKENIVLAKSGKKIILHKKKIKYKKQRKRKKEILHRTPHTHTLPNISIV